MKKFKKGAASFYVVAFSTLILLIIVASFTALVVAQITRSSNDDLSQSAYDSALAGVEDAKLAYFNYENCVAQGATPKEWDGEGEISCGEIIWLIDNMGDDCDVVAKVLGRTIVEGYGVSVDEISKTNTDNNNMQQSYTCTQLQTSLKDYRTSLSTANPMKAINVTIDDRDGALNVDLIEKIKISWGSDLSQSDVQLSNYVGGKVKYPKVSSDSPAANPPTIALAIVQAGEEFKTEDFDSSKNGQTNKGVVYMTPVDLAGKKTDGSADNYVSTDYDAANRMSVIPKDALLKSNNHTYQNLPYGVSCPNVGAGDFACSVMIDLPKPINGVRADGNFVVAVSLPYGAPTDISLEFFCADGNLSCGTEKVFCEAGDPECSEDGVKEEGTEQINLKGIQIAVDSTGRANDLFRRVETRLEGTGDFALSVMGPLELFGGKEGDTGDSVSLEKDWTVACEYNFASTCP